MSSSPLSSTASDPQTIETTIRRVVREGAKNGEEITVRSARTRAEEELGLDAGFLKDDAEWKARSKSVIEAAFNEPDSPVKAKQPKGRKRKSDDEAEGTKKKAKKAPVAEESEVEDEDDDFAEEEEKPKPKPKSRARKPPPKKAAKVSDEEDLGASEVANQKIDSADSSALSDPPEESAEPEPPQKPSAEDDESDMSELIDEPARRTKSKSKPKAQTKAKPAAKARSTTKSKPAAADLPPDEAEIKRLQSQLIACGIRKLWHKELPPFPTPAKKIAHLKQMLSDAGMTGRYSLEKARAIKEARELKAELESAREFEAKWGQGNDDGEEEGEEAKEESGSGEVKRSAGGRVLPKGLVDFGDSGDEESD